MSLFWRFALLLVSLSALASSGCGESKPSSVVDSSNQDAIQEYEAMMQAEEKAAQEGMAAATGE